MALAADLRLKTCLLICFGPVGQPSDEPGNSRHRSRAQFEPRCPVPLRPARSLFPSGLAENALPDRLFRFLHHRPELADYSYVQAATALMYVVVAIRGRFVLDEKVTPLRSVGIAVVCLGVSVIGSTSLRTTDHSGREAGARRRAHDFRARDFRDRTDILHRCGRNDGGDVRHASDEADRRGEEILRLVRSLKRQGAPSKLVGCGSGWSRWLWPISRCLEFSPART
jgi:hypothetical protein